MSGLKFRAHGADSSVQAIQKAAFIYLQTCPVAFFQTLLQWLVQTRACISGASGGYSMFGRGHFVF